MKFAVKKTKTCTETLQFLPDSAISHAMVNLAFTTPSLWDLAQRSIFCCCCTQLSAQWLYLSIPKFLLVSELKIPDFLFLFFFCFNRHILMTNEYKVLSLHSVKKFPISLETVCLEHQHSFVVPFWISWLVNLQVHLVWRVQWVHITTATGVEIFTCL